MTIRTLAAASLLIAGAAHADPFADAHPEAGGDIHTNQCVACHATSFGGTEGSDIYTRSDRRVTSPDALLQQITFCTTQLDLSLFPEDERDIAAYLNMHYYHFQ